MNVFRHDPGVSLAALVEETRRVSSGWDWRRGAFGHALSLPRADQLHPYRRYGYENHPCTGVLDGCPGLRAVFDSLRTDKVSFRLLRRAPRSAYAWHTDRWKGPGVVRFQIPIVSDDAAFLVTTDYRSVADVRGGEAPLCEESFAAFAAANAGHFARHRLERGVLHYFDTSRVHTLVNAGDEERLTLSFDLVANDWLRARFPEIEAELGPAPVAALPRPGPARGLLRRAAAALHPLRTRLHGLRRSHA